MMKRVRTVPRLMYEIRPSKALLGEVATFAVRNIKIGEIIADVDSPEEVVILKHGDLKKIDSVTRKKIERFCLQDEDGEYIVPVDLNNMGSSWYFNHSCAPNIAYDRKGNFIAARNIKKDEELFLDYGRMFTDPKLRMKCACGADNCRGLVTGNDWLDPQFQKKNKDLMWPEMRRGSRSKK